MPNTPDTLGIARIVKLGPDGGGETHVGMAIIVDQRHVMTCCHVVNDALGRSVRLDPERPSPEARFKIRFPFAGNAAATGVVVEWGLALPQAKDVAVLRLEEEAPADAGVATLRELDVRRDRWFCVGWDNRGNNRETEGIFGTKLASGEFQLNAVSGRAPVIDHGYSGAGVWSDAANAFVGMVVSKDRDQAETGLAYAIPTSVLLGVWPKLEGAALALGAQYWITQGGSSQIRAKIMDQQSLIADRTRDFVGRSSIFRRLDEHIRSETGAAYVFIEGDPGIGKSAIMARLAMTRSCVRHFNDYTANIRSANAFLTSICAQLVARYELPYNDLPPTVGENSALFGTLLSLAAQKSCDPVLVLVDALDEAEPSEQRINRLFLPKRLPKGCFIVVTNRVGVERKVMTEMPVHTIFIDSGSRENETDLEEYIRVMLEKDRTRVDALTALWGGKSEDLVSAIRNKAEGNFMYVHFAIPALLGPGEDSLEKRLATLPAGLERYYHSHLDVMRSADTEKYLSLQEPIICFLARAREPVSVREISTWMLGAGFTAGNERRVHAVLTKEWAQFIRPEQADPPKYQLYHRSFLEFLESQIDLASYERLIADAMNKLVD
jgi:hypothetical protein